MKFAKALYFISFLFLFIQCKKEETPIPENFSKILDFTKFTLTVSEDWTTFNPPFHDGFFGGITNTIDTLYFDYGPESYSGIDDITEDEDDIKFTSLKINGNDAKIVKEKRAGETQIRFSMYVDTRDGNNHNRIYGYGIKNEIDATIIFKSHKFK